MNLVPNIFSVISIWSLPLFLGWKKSNVSNGITKNNFSCHINCQLYCHIKLLKKKPNFLFTPEIKFGENWNYKIPNFLFLSRWICKRNILIQIWIINDVITHSIQFPFLFTWRLCYKMEYKLIKIKSLKSCAFINCAQFVPKGTNCHLNSSRSKSLQLLDWPMH